MIEGINTNSMSNTSTIHNLILNIDINIKQYGIYYLTYNMSNSKYRVWAMGMYDI